MVRTNQNAHSAPLLTTKANHLRSLQVIRGLYSICTHVRGAVVAPKSGVNSLSPETCARHAHIVRISALEFEHDGCAVLLFILSQSGFLIVPPWIRSFDIGSRMYVLLVLVFEPDVIIHQSILGPIR